MLLQSHSSFGTLAELNETTGELKEFSRADARTGALNRIEGCFDVLGDQIVALYRLDEILFVLVGNKRLRLDECQIQLQSEGQMAKLFIVCRKGIALEVEYERRLLDPPLSQDPTAFAEAEDFDFGLFLSNVSRDCKRQERLFLS
jgi:hypothetical protein